MARHETLQTLASLSWLCHVPCAWTCLDRCISQQLPLLGTLDALHVWIGVDAISLGFACAVSAMVLQKCGQTIAEVPGRNADKVLTTVYLNFELFRLFA